jgi:chromosome segregation ATPase
VTDSGQEFELVEFEQVEAAPGTALLRIAARPSAATSAGPMTLVISDGTHEYRHEQLPALPGPPGLVRAAFSAALDHVGRGTTFSLAMADGTTVRLPAPSRRRAAGHSLRPSDPPRPHGAEIESSRLIEAERRAEARRLALTELERRLTAERERRTTVENETARLRAERDEARAEREQAVAERDEAQADRDQAEARARAAAASSGSFEAQVRAAGDAATRVQSALETQLTDRNAELDRMRASVELAQSRAHTSRRETIELTEQLANAQAQLSVLSESVEARVSAARAEGEGSKTRVAELEAELESLRDKLETAESTAAEKDVLVAERDEALTEWEDALAERDQALAIRTAEVDLLRGSAEELKDANRTLDEALEAARLNLGAAAEVSRAGDASAAEATRLREQIERHRSRVTELEEQLADAAEREAAKETALIEATAERQALTEELAAEVTQRHHAEERGQELFSRLADEHAQADAARDIIRAQSL